MHKIQLPTCNDYEKKTSIKIGYNADLDDLSACFLSRLGNNMSASQKDQLVRIPDVEIETKIAPEALVSRICRDRDFGNPPSRTAD